MTPLNGKHIRIVQVTDPHIGETPDYTLASVNTLQSFSVVMEALRSAEQQPQLLAVTGDIAAEGARDAYQLFVREITKAGVPYAWLPGNHDSFEVMCEQLQSPSFQEIIELPGWRLLFLVSAVEGAVGGELNSRQLKLLRSVVGDDNPTPVVVFIHHPPSKVGCDWLDKQRVSNSNALAAIIEGSDKVKAIFTGHVHQESDGEWSGVPVFTAPSTCVQFAANSAGFALSDKGPGYRWIDLFENGRFETGVCYVANEGQETDQACIGY